MVSVPEYTYLLHRLDTVYWNRGTQEPEDGLPEWPGQYGWTRTDVHWAVLVPPVVWRQAWGRLPLLLLYWAGSGSLLAPPAFQLFCRLASESMLCVNFENLVSSSSGSSTFVMIRTMEHQMKESLQSSEVNLPLQIQNQRMHAASYPETEILLFPYRKPVHSVLSDELLNQHVSMYNEFDFHSVFRFFMCSHPYRIEMLKNIVIK